MANDSAMQIQTVVQILIALGAVAGVVAVYVAVRALRANHDWNRRHFAVLIGQLWNDRTIAHRRAIEAAFPGIIDVDRQGDLRGELTREDARRIYTSEKGTREWELRFHIVELLNYFENISIAYLHNVSDRTATKDSFRSPFARWFEAVRNYIDTVHENRGYDPWKSYVQVVSEWAREERPQRHPTDRL